jgi:CubicO group peptidase (beta-lactamase class C family)
MRPHPTGPAVPALSAFDDAVEALLRDQTVPGAALAIGYRGRLVFARGYGWANLATQAAVPPDALFRTASLSKPITAHLLLKLANRGLVRLDDFVTQHLPEELAFSISAINDERWYLVTLRQLLQHTAGWNREATDFDPMFESTLIAEAYGVLPPADTTSIIRYMLDRPLDFQPGTRYAYSNFGYCLLGRVIERATGLSYLQAARSELWEPLQLGDEFHLGRTRPSDRHPREVTYYPTDDVTEPSVFADSLGQPVPPPDGAWCLETMDAHGGWVASAPALVLWSMSLDPPIKGWLRSETWIDAHQRPPGPPGLEPDGSPKSVYYGLGWLIRPVAEAGGFHRWHAGSLDGTSTLLIRRADDVTFAVLFNKRHADPAQTPAKLIEPKLHALADSIQHWPEHDLAPALFPHR